MRSRLLHLVSLGVMLLATGTAQAQYDLSWWTVNGGGQMFSMGGSFSLGGTLGQPDARPTAMTGGTFQLIGGFWAAAAPLAGDLNCDGLVNFKDINPFVVYLSNFSGWQTLFPGCPPENGDINGDGTYPSLKDINSFVVLLSSGG